MNLKCHFFKAKIPQIVWFQRLSCENLLVFLVLYDSKLNIVGFWTIVQPKKAIFKMSTWALEPNHYSQKVSTS